MIVWPLYTFPTFCLPAFFFVEKLQPLYIEMAPKRTLQALQQPSTFRPFCITYFFFVENLQPLYIEMAPKRTPQALQQPSTFASQYLGFPFFNTLRGLRPSKNARSQAASPPTKETTNQTAEGPAA